MKQIKQCIKDLFKSKKELDLRIEGYCFALFIEELKEQGLYKDGNVKCKIMYEVDDTPIRCRYDDDTTKNGCIYNYDNKFFKEYCYKEIEEMILLSKLK